jgi:hypothetical protein
MVFGCGLREPDVAAITPKMAGLHGLSNIFFDDDGTASSVDEP